MNLLQNFSTIDLTIIGLGLTLFNYSLYCLYTQSIPLGYKTIYFYDNISDTSNSIDTESINSTETIKNNLTQNSEITDRLDEVIGLLKAEGPNLYHLSDEALKDRILTILHGLCSQGDDLSDVSTMRQSIFESITREDPGNRDFFGNINNWLTDIQTNSTSSTNNFHFEKLDEQIEVISLVVKELKSHISNNLVESNLNNLHIRDYFNVSNPLINKLYEILSKTNPDITIDQINNFVTSSSLILTESNFINVLTMLFKAFNTFN